MVHVGQKGAMIVRDGTVRADGGRSIDDRVYRVE